MKIGQDKVISLSNAVENYVKDGSSLSIGGFTINRNPMAAVYEIIRQKKQHLHVFAHSNGPGIDELIGGGCVKRLEIAYAGSGRFASTCIRFKRAVQNNTIEVEDYTNYQMSLRFLAGSMGVPFLPTRSSLGTDIINKWGFSRDMRAEAPDLPDKKLVVMDNPFDSWTGVKKLVLVPAVNPDVTIIHAQKADSKGCTRIEGLSFADIEQAKAAKSVIVTCEDLVDSSFLKKTPDANQLPPFCVDAVVHVPFGAYPTACFNWYDYDPEFLTKYKKAASDDDLYEAYRNEYILGTSDHEDFLKKACKGRLDAIKADPETGYAKNLKRN